MILYQWIKDNHSPAGSRAIQLQNGLEGWRSTWRGLMLQNIGCLINLVVLLPPSPHPDPTSLGNACLWFSFCETGSSMLWHTVKWLLFWCRDMFLLMGRLGQIKPTHLFHGCCVNTKDKWELPSPLWHQRPLPAPLPQRWWL